MADQIKIILPDGKEGLHPAGATVKEILAGLDGEKFRSMAAAKVNGALVDLSRPLTGDAAVEPIDPVDSTCSRPPEMVVAPL